MRRFMFVMLVASMCAACVESNVEELRYAGNGDVPETIYVSLDDDTRVQLNASGKTVWTAGDELTAFYKSDANSRFAFRGNTGDRNGGFTVAEQGVKSKDIDEVILLYPYSNSYVLDVENRSVDIKIPAKQRYEAGSYGVGANLMASVETGDNFTLKSLCGWIAVQLKGAGRVTSITLTGNNGEQLAGDATFNYADFDLELLYYPSNPEDDSEVGGSLIFGDYQQTITLECEEGVELHYTEPTDFYFVVAPQTFDKGITIEATCSDGTVLTKSSSNALTVERNHIVPMSPLTVMEDIPDNEIWYTSTDGNIVEPYNNSVFGATLISNVYKNGMGVMTFDGEVTKIGTEAFRDCNLTSITIPDSVTWIGDVAFYECTSLTSITIPDSVTTIREQAFYWCNSLTAFYGKFASEDNRCLIIDGVLNSFAIGCGLTEYTIPDDVTTIGDGAFEGCTSLTSVTIPDSATWIGDVAFLNCTSLRSITIPDSVTTIGDSAFNSCISLTSVTIPDSVTTIGYCAFYFCESLTSVTIPDSVTAIGDGAFCSCDSLESITIPDSVTAIGDGAFYWCTSLESITIPDSVTTIGDSAFNSCISLTSVTIPDSVTAIGEQAFAYCTSLESVYCMAIIPPSLGIQAFDYYANDYTQIGCPIYVPTESVEAYKVADGWSEYADNIIGYDF